jgi:2-polyprenyl-6-hydroxyphenyl methylase/3-demethylubiquinone-9 3-methyltransferase
LELATKFVEGISNVSLSQMNAANLSFREHTFDCVVCIQNGISAFHVDPRILISESMRVAKPESLILFSTYAANFWEERLRWFQLQSQAKLLGEIDYEKTRPGVIVCKDGFTATTLGPEEFSNLTKGIDANVRIVEVDESSLFCEIERHNPVVTVTKHQ